jgi:hypothetical protein
MVAKIKSGKSLIGAINYNERKVKIGKAKLIAAQSYAKDHDRLTFDDKLFRLKDLAARNFRTKTNTVHLSLNFDITENPDRELLLNVADSYMEKIGFGNQPYLVYQHFDAGHPHIHIVATNIEADGNRISLHNIGRLISEPARKEIEIEFGLVQADSKKDLNKQVERNQLKPLVYGSTETKRAITNIVNEVIRSYKFTSLPEFNAVLNMYNISADRGTRESVMFDKGGLRYWALNQEGEKTGVPIKASSIYKKPTLKLLDDQFRLGEYLRRPFRESLKKNINKALIKAKTHEHFIDELKKTGITGLFRKNSDGRIYGVTYVDHSNRVVFNGSDLGKNYTAAAIVQALTTGPEIESAATSFTGQSKEPFNIPINDYNTGHSRSLLDDLLGPANQAGSENLFERKKKKKRKKLNL